MDKILRNTNIWDLHIHTPLGTPTKKNYGNASTEEFIDTIIDIYNKSNNKIGMISFTDHNKINADAYELFKIKSDIAIIPGINKQTNSILTIFCYGYCSTEMFC